MYQTRLRNSKGQNENKPLLPTFTYHRKSYVTGVNLYTEISVLRNTELTTGLLK